MWPWVPLYRIACAGWVAHRLQQAGVRHNGARTAVDAVDGLVGPAERGLHARALVHDHKVPGQSLQGRCIAHQCLKAGDDHIRLGHLHLRSRHCYQASATTAQFT